MRKRLLRGIGLLLAPLSIAAAAAWSAEAQATADGWNDVATLDLVQRAIERRSTQVVDTALVNYRADARGYVYFLLDAPEAGRESLVRTDQVALEVYWQAPDQVRQRIVGWRERSELPVRRLHYYMDRLTVVQDNYGEGIVIADGDNVNDVPHPIAAGAEVIYDYRMVDSLTLRLPGAPDPVRVREVQVRPRDSSRPAILGSVFLEAGTGALVRMSFTFTPSAYVDPRLDFINVTLENGLWEGRFWLPHEQRLEIRREMPELDLPFGTVIRTRMRIGDYRLNQRLPEGLFASRITLSAVPASERAAFPFEQPIHAEWRLEGIGPPVEVGELRREARTIVSERALSGLPRARPGIEAASDLFRYNRAEGFTVGIGGGLRPSEDVQLRLGGGWAFGAGHPVLRAGIAGGDAWRTSVTAYLNRPGDAGGFTAASGVANTLGSLLFASDATDPFHASGVAASVALPLAAGWSGSLETRVERQRSASLSSDFALLRPGGAFRPVREIDGGDHLSAALSLRRDARTPAGGWWGESTTAAARLLGAQKTLGFARILLDAGRLWTSADYGATLELTGSAGTLLGELPRQELFLLGGRGTIPGYDFRSFGGDRYALGQARASASIAHPWLRARAFAGLAWTGAATETRHLLESWDAAPAAGLRPSIGLGLGVFYDLLHLDVARGLGPGGRFQIIAEFQPEFWGWM